MSGTFDTGLQKIEVRKLRHVPTEIIGKAAEVVELVDPSILEGDDWFTLDWYFDLNLHTDEDGLWASIYEYPARLGKRVPPKDNPWCLISILIRKEVAQ